MLAFLTGVIRMILVFVYHDSGGCGEEDPRPAVLKNFHYMYFSLFITLLTAAAAVIISFLTEKPKEKHVSERISSQKEYGQTHRYIGFFTGTKRNQEVHSFLHTETRGKHIRTIVSLQRNQVESTLVSSHRNQWKAHSYICFRMKPRGECIIICKYTVASKGN